MAKFQRRGTFPSSRRGLTRSGKPWDQSLSDLVEVLEPSASVVNLPKHSKVVEEGQLPPGIFVLLHGSVKLCVSLETGPTMIFRLVQSKEVLGLSALISGNPSQYTAETVDLTQFLFVSRKEFLELLTHHPKLCTSVVGILSHQLREAINMVHFCSGAQPAVEKLADLLKLWIAEIGKPTDRGIELQLLLTQKEIGQMLGVSRETVGRLLAELECQGVLQLTGGSSIYVLKKEALDELSIPSPRRDRN